MPDSPLAQGIWRKARLKSRVTENSLLHGRNETGCQAAKVTLKTNGNVTKELIPFYHTPFLINTITFADNIPDSQPYSLHCSFIMLI